MLTSMDKRTVKLHAAGDEYSKAISLLHHKTGMVRSEELRRA